VLRLLNEPTAAALAYGLDKQRTRGTFAVYDLGGGTFDITVLSLDDGVFQVRSTGGDSQLGGDDIDRAVGPGAPRARWASATRPRPRVRAGALLDARGRPSTSSPTRPRGAGHAPARGGRVHAAPHAGGLRSAVRCRWWSAPGPACRRALRDAGVKPQELDGVILVGGSTRVPLVRAYVRELFGKEPLTDIDPDQVVALGAASRPTSSRAKGSRGRRAHPRRDPALARHRDDGRRDREDPPAQHHHPRGAGAAVHHLRRQRQTGFELHVVQGERELAARQPLARALHAQGDPPDARGRWRGWR
jgi:molecular chaperone HscA